MNTHKETLLQQALQNPKNAKHPAAAKRVAERAKQTLLSRASRMSRAAVGRAQTELLGKNPGGSFHSRESFKVPFAAELI